MDGASGPDDRPDPRRRPGSDDDRWDHVIRHIQDAVVEFELVDSEPIVRWVNRSFEEVFGWDRTEVIGQSLNDRIVPDWSMTEARELDDRTATGKVNYQHVRRQTATGLREFLYRGIPYEGVDASVDGFAVYTDLTETNRRERQLQVLNRILRHNLRNCATVVNGHTGRLLDVIEEPPPAVVDAVSTLQDAAGELEHLAAGADEIRQVVEEDDDYGTVDCARLARRLADEYRDRHPDAAIETDFPERLEVASGSQLGLALENLIENAIEHNPADEPTVRICASVETAGEWVDVRVDDDAPPIPAAERAVITRERPITQTEHGQGLGLWLVAWTVEQFGGEVQFRESDVGGNSVRLRLPLPAGD